MSEITETEIKSMAKEQNYLRGYADGKSDVLEDIREDIEKLEEGISSYHNDRPWVFKDEVLQIIDHCKAEMR